MCVCAAQMPDYVTEGEETQSPTTQLVLFCFGQEMTKDKIKKMDGPVRRYLSDISHLFQKMALVYKMTQLQRKDRREVWCNDFLG